MNLQEYFKETNAIKSQYYSFLTLVVLPLYNKRGEYTKENGKILTNNLKKLYNKYNTVCIWELTKPKDIHYNTFRISKDSKELIEKEVEEFIKLYPSFKTTHILEFLHIYWQEIKTHIDKLVS